MSVVPRIAGTGGRHAILACLLTVAFLVAPAESGARSAGNVDFRGTWQVSSSCCNFTITSQSASGACTGTVGSPGFTISGCKVTGDTFVFTTVQTSTSYRSANSGTISGNSLNAQFKDTNGNAVPYTATRAAAPSSPPGSPSTGDEQTVCIDGCSTLQTTYDSTLAPGDTSVSVGAGCDGGSAPRVTSSASSHADGQSCGIDSTLNMTPEQLEAAGANMLDMEVLNQIAKDAQNQQTKRYDAAKDLQDQINALEQEYFDSHPKGPPADPTHNPAIDAYLRAYEAPADAPALAVVDNSLSGEFPVETANTIRRPASAFAVHAPDPNLVLASVTSANPSAADRAAFTTEIGLATAPSYSPARGVARLTLVLTFEIGHFAVLSDLKLTHSKLRSAPAITLGSAHANVPAKGSRKLTIKTSALGGRVLRLLSILGLSHHTTAQLGLRSTIGGKSKSLTRQIQIT